MAASGDGQPRTSGGGGVIYRFSSDIVAVNGILPTSGPASEATAVQLFGGGFTPEATVTIGGGNRGPT